MFVRDSIFIGGEWVPSTSTDRIDVRSPSTEEIIGRVPNASRADVDRAVHAAREAFERGPWPHLSIDERATLLTALVDEIDVRADALIDAQIDEMGGTRQFIGINHRAIRPFLQRLLHDNQFVRHREVRDGTAGKVVVIREPVGVAAGITPWNAPVMVAITKLFPSLLMGCPMVLKPAPESPISAYLLAEAIEAVGFPPGLVSILPGGLDPGAALVEHPGIDTVTFTGSSSAGQRIAAACGEQLKHYTLELGGKSAAIVVGDVDLEPYLPSLIGNSLRNCGQICISTNRVLVPDDRYDEVRDLVADYVAAMTVGDPHEPGTDFGPLAAERQRVRVEEFVASGRDEGAKVVLGGGRPAGFPRGWYVEPTIFTEVDNNMRIAREEIFGPVLSLIRYRDVDEAVNIANDSDYGLGGAVFAADAEYGLSVARRMRTGTIQVNEAPPSGGGGPFGGYKRSGVGRERGPEGLESFLEVKSVSLPPGFVPAA